MTANLKILGCIGAFLFALPVWAFERQAGSDSKVRAVSLQSAKRAPQGFIPNRGQYPHKEARFVARDNGMTACFTENGFQLWNGKTTAVSEDGIRREVPVAPRWELAGANPVSPVGGRKFHHTVSFFHGNDRTKWHANLPAFRDLRYPEILKGVEMRVESREHGFEYAFHVQPHAKPELRFRYDGITGLETTASGDLVVRTAIGQFTESRPVSYQFVDGKRVEVASVFEILSTNEYRIAVGPHDERYELVVDPVLDWSTSIGGSQSDQLDDIAVDRDGNVIVAGSSVSANLPANAAFSSNPGMNTGSLLYRDAYVAKLSADGTQLLWAGYLGSDGPYDSIAGRKALAIDQAGNVYICGFTESPVFPTTTGPAHSGLADAFVTKIAANGSQLLWSTLLGTPDDDWGYAITLDPSGNVYLAGQTFTAADQDQDMLLAKLDGATGAVLWNTYIGGSKEERPAAIVADAGGFLIFGDTDSADFPATVGQTTLGGSNDAFIAKMNSDGSFGWATLLGGSQAETGHQASSSWWNHTFGKGGIALDSAGQIVVAGTTFSADFPGLHNQTVFQPALRGVSDGFIAKLSADGSTLLWASYLGGSGPADPTGREDAVMSIVLNPWDEIFVCGWTVSSDFPVTADGLKRAMQADGRMDGFLAKVSVNGSSILSSSYLGSDGWDDVALGLHYDSGNLFVDGWHLDTWFQRTAGAYLVECDNCGSDVFLMKFLDDFIAHDGFESGGFSGGLGDWAGGWRASGDVSILTSSGPHSGARHALLRSGTGDLKRNAEVAGSTAVKLGYWAKVSSFESSDRAHVRVSADGVNWITLRSFTSGQSDNQYHYYEDAVPTQLLPATQLLVHFDAAMSASNDYWYLDDIRVTGLSGPVPPVANAGPDQTVTDSDGNGRATVTLNGSASVDPDGGAIVSYQWSGGAVGTGPSLTADLGVGVHTVTLTVTDDEGATGSDSVQIAVLPRPAAIHSGDLDGSSALSGKAWKATVQVTVHDGNDNPVSGATVSVQWGGGVSGPTSLTTDANGRCAFVSGSISKAIPSATLSIMNMSHPALSYDASANHDPEGDSNGTTIVVNRP